MLGSGMGYMRGLRGRHHGGSLEQVSVRSGTTYKYRPEGIPDCEGLFLESTITSRCFENTCGIVFVNAAGPSEVRSGTTYKYRPEGIQHTVCRHNHNLRPVDDQFPELIVDGAQIVIVPTYCMLNSFWSVLVRGT
jgi:hypothetical protein